MGLYGQFSVYHLYILSGKIFVFLENCCCIGAGGKGALGQGEGGEAGGKREEGEGEGAEEDEERSERQVSLIVLKIL
jgi:hypothetical protein